MDALPLLPDGALGAPRYDCRHPPLAPGIKLEDNVSPKSVIADIRFISPASSSSSSMDRRPLSDANHVKLPQPRHDRGYSISDGESSDQDTLLESSRELNKVCAISGSLESLPETHSLALKATRTNIYRGEGRPYQSAASLPTIEDKHQIQQSKRTSHPSVTSAQDSISISSAENHSGSGSSRVNFQTGVSSQGTPALNGFDEENRGSAVRSPVDYPGTPVRFSPGWQAQLGSPGGSHISLGSPGVEKGNASYSPASYSPASLADHLSRGIPFQHRFLSGPLHGGKSPRPPPSKWDDAEKWIASPGHQESSPQNRPNVQALPSGRRHSISGNCHRPNFGLGSPEFSTSNADEKPLSLTFEHTNGRGECLTRSASQKKRSKTLSFGDLSKRVFDISCSDACQTTSSVPKFDGPVAEIEESSKNIGHGSSHETQSNVVTMELDRRHESPSNVLPSTQSRECGNPESLEDDKSKTLGTARCADNSMDVEILKHALTESMKEIDSHQLQSAYPAVGPPPPSGHSWKFGRRTSSTESNKNSTSIIPAFTASPTRHNTPARSGRRPASFGSFNGAGELELQTCQFATLELCKLGGDDRNTAWTTREEEDMECSISLRDNDSGVLERGVVDEKTPAWEEAEQTEHSKRCDKEEARIKAWEELQTSKAEAEMQKLEMKIEKMRARALEKMTNRIALARKKAKQMRASAHATRSDQTAKTMQQVKQIHIPVLGHVSPIPKSPFTCCFKP